MKQLAVFVFFLAALNAGAQDNRALFAFNHYAAQNFIAGAVSAADLNTVLQAGIRAPSARNRQPWHFTVIRGQALAKKILSDAAEGNVIIVLSVPGDSRINGADMLDCGIAVESMYLSAQAIGLGSRIYTNPIEGINKNLKAELGLPAGYSAVVLVRIGKTRPPVDAHTSASTRKPASELVTYKD